MTKVFNLGKINLHGTGKRFPVEVTVSLETYGDDIHRPMYTEFTAHAMVGQAMGGQCLDDINKHRDDFSSENRKLWDTIYELWKKYHLNGMHAGTPEQEAAIKALRACKPVFTHINPDEIIEFLKSIDLYEVPYYGKGVARIYTGEPYRYGSAWLVSEIPSRDIDRIEALLHGNV